MRVLLKHRSRLPGSEGAPGSIVDVNAELGARWIDEGAAEATKEKATPAEERQGTPERNKLIKGDG